MTRPREASPASALVRLFAQPALACGLSIPQWDGILRVARKEQLLSRLGAVMAQRPDLQAVCPTEMRAMFRAAWAYPSLVQDRANWELTQLLAATADLGVEFILLKGVGYLRAGLPLARARAFADVDLLVPQSQLAAVEARLLAQGWEHYVNNSYDQRYYRQWMHEIPPLRHPVRQMEVDLHHRILPRTARLSPDPAPLWAASLPVGPRLRVLSPPDMVLHCAAHLFADGEIKGCFRDLLDLHQMLTEFASRDEALWEQLVGRARLLKLGRPLYYAIRFCVEFLDTPVPVPTRRAVAQFAPAAPVARLMGVLVRAVLLPREVGRTESSLAAWLLYVRSHWLRMPPWLLGKHLARKAVRRLSGAWPRVPRPP